MWKFNRQFYNTNNDVPLRPDNCSISTFERLTIAYADNNKTLNTRNELATRTTNQTILNLNF